MVMKGTEIVQIAIENLRKTADVDGNWENQTNNELDGVLTLIIDNEKVAFNTEIKKELRNHQLIQLDYNAREKPPFMIIAERIFPGIKEQLRQLKIAYLEANGNVFFHEKRFRYFIDANKPLKTAKEKRNRAFTKTGVKVLFHFLLKPELINLPHREIAEITGVAHGNIAYIFNGLKGNGFLARMNKNTFQLMNKKELLNKWMVAYKETLQPTLEIGRFRFANEENFTHWRNINLHEGETWWGGEPAGDLLTNYLRPGELTIYTTETRNELMRNYRLIPDPTGDVRVYKKFWNNEIMDNNKAVPPLLTYVDLTNTGDKRCLETAEIIYNQHVEPNL
jgi:hypothetical protein